MSTNVLSTTFTGSDKARCPDRSIDSSKWTTPHVRIKTTRFKRSAMLIRWAPARSFQEAVDKQCMSPPDLATDLPTCGVALSAKRARGLEMASTSEQKDS